MRPSPEQLFYENLTLAYHFGHSWARRLAGVMETEDVLQLAMIGLWRACLAWDPDRGQLSTLAAVCIRNECLQAARQEGRALVCKRQLAADDRLRVSVPAFAHPEAAAVLGEAIAHLHPIARQALALQRREVAQAFGISQRMVSYHRMQARRQMEAAL